MLYIVIGPGNLTLYSWQMNLAYSMQKVKVSEMSGAAFLFFNQ
jgi:hypothetical protein